MTSSDVTISQVLNFSSKEANDLQMEIENFTKKIEHERINYKLCEERNQKQLETYNILHGKPIAKTKEQKEKERKEKEKNKSEKNLAQKKVDKSNYNMIEAGTFIKTFSILIFQI